MQLLDLSQLLLEMDLSCKVQNGKEVFISDDTGFAFTYQYEDLVELSKDDVEADVTEAYANYVASAGTEEEDLGSMVTKDFVDDVDGSKFLDDQADEVIADIQGSPSKKKA